MQQRLQSEFLPILPLQVSCILREETLMILMHSPELVNPYAKPIFPWVRQLIAQDPICQDYQVEMYLIVHGQKQLEETITSPISEETSNLETDFSIEPEEWTASINNDKINHFLSSLKLQLQKLSKFQLLLITGGTGMSLLMFLGSIYGLTRPCVISRCQTIVQAEQLTEQPLKIFHQIPSEQEVINAQQKLKQAITLLQAIPIWSSYHEKAQTLLDIYQDYSENVAEIVTLLETASNASKLTKDSPLSISKLSEIQQLWQKVVTSLEKLSYDSNLSSFATIKLQEYRGNLAKVNQQLEAEKQAKVSLQAAQEAAKIAQTRSNTAESLSDWQLVYATWQTVVKRLREVSSQTTAYPEAKQLLVNYQSQLVTTGVRKNQEQVAFNIYNQAIEQAEVAKKAESNNQWLIAVSSWRNALTYLQQVPKTTFKYNQVQPLILSYSLALKQAENQLKNNLKSQEISGDLDKICLGENTICSYTVDENLIKVNLTPSYLQKVWRTALQAQAQTNVETQVELLNHISRLEQSLQNVSNKTGKRVEVFNSEGILMMNYEPRI